MTKRERVYEALRFRETDTVPYNISFTVEERERMAEYLGDANFQERLGNHFAWFSVRKLGRKQLSPDFIQDEWGVVWNTANDREVGIVENSLLPEPTLRNLEVPNPLALGDQHTYREFTERNRDNYRVVMIGFTLFERAWSLRGLDQLLMDMYTKPQFVHDLLDIIAEYCLAHVDRALAHDIDCVGFGDDWGAQSGLIMGADLWRTFIKPRAMKLYQRVRGADRHVLIHCCGSVAELFPELIEMGVNIFNPFQPECMDLHSVKKQFHGKLAFYGGISVQHLLPHGTCEEVRSATMELLKTLGKGGGYIAGPSHAVPKDVPPENVMAMLEVLQNQNNYI